MAHIAFLLSPRSTHNRPFRCHLAHFWLIYPFVLDRATYILYYFYHQKQVNEDFSSVPHSYIGWMHVLKEQSEVWLRISSSLQMQIILLQAPPPHPHLPPSDTCSNEAGIIRDRKGGPGQSPKSWLWFGEKNIPGLPGRTDRLKSFTLDWDLSTTGRPQAPSSLFTQGSCMAIPFSSWLQVLTQEVWAGPRCLHFFFLL